MTRLVDRIADLRVFGGDYETPDGTGVRDYIHVVDLARGHLAALDALVRHDASLVANPGTSQGDSVPDVVRSFEQASGGRGVLLRGSGRGCEAARLAGRVRHRVDVCEPLAGAIDEPAQVFAGVASGNHLEQATSALRRACFAGSRAVAVNAREPGYPSRCEVTVATDAFCRRRARRCSHTEAG
jgi:hypothetical protein